MISNLQKTAEQSLLETLENSQFEFFLTGSRYFGMAKEQSDYDLFSKACIEVQQFLYNNGFLEKFENQYESDQNLVSLWENGKIQIQLVRDANLKNQVQQILKSNSIFTICVSSINKNSAKNFWNLAYAAFKGGMLYLEEELKKPAIIPEETVLQTSEPFRNVLD